MPSSRTALAEAAQQRSRPRERPGAKLRLTLSYEDQPGKNAGATSCGFFPLCQEVGASRRSSNGVRCCRIDRSDLAVKLDELIRATEGAHNALLDLEDLTDIELARVRKRYEALAVEARVELGKGLRDAGVINA